MSASEKKSIIAPGELLGFEVGEDRKLADWPQIVEYFKMLDGLSDRVVASEVGKTTEGNPFLVVTISSPRNLAQLDRYRDIQARLADPRTVHDEAEAGELIAAGKVVALITCSIHATEVGATQMSMLLGHHLATSEQETVERVLDDVILLLVPCLNPDGLVLVKKWYDSTLGTEFEGVHPPFLYHKYAGHDNNRDWFMFTQAETRLAVEHCHNAWHPQIVLDMHQTRTGGMRLILPPFVDPTDPNVAPILQSGTAMLGTTIAAALTGQGKEGVGVNVVYDAYSPSRVYAHYHGGVRILSEVASARLATPIEVQSGEMASVRGADPTTRSWNHPAPWKGGRWSLKDIVEYNLEVVMACLDNAARYRDLWLRNFYAVGKDAVSEKVNPCAYLVLLDQRDPATAVEMLQVLCTAAVEVHQATESFEADGIKYPAGTVVVPLAQPYGAFAKTMMEVPSYPEVLQYDGGPLRPPYDNTAHNLPIQMGVETVEVQGPFEAKTRLIEDPQPPEGKVVRCGAAQASAYILRPDSNASVRAVNRLLDSGVAVGRARESLAVDGAKYPPGTFIIEGGATTDRLVTSIVREESLTFEASSAVPSVDRFELRTPRVGVYRSYVPTAEEGWTRFIFEGHGLPYTTLFDRDIKQGALVDGFDAILLPHQPVSQIHEGHSAAGYPAEYADGLGHAGARGLHDFVEQGGTLIAWDGGAEYAIRYLDLPINNVLADVPDSDFYAPGGLLRVLLDTTHPVAYGMPSRCAAMFVHGPAFDIREGTVVGKYPHHDPLLCGWVLGAERLAGKAAVATVPLGRGEVVLIGFRVHFRAQTRGTYRILFNSVFHSVTG